MGRPGNSRHLVHLLCGLALWVDLASGLRVGQASGETAASELPGHPFEDGQAREWYFKRWDCTPKEAPLPQAEDPEGKLKTVHVVYSADAKELPGVLLSMTSLSRHLKKPEDCVVHLIVAKDILPQAENLVKCFNRSSSETGALPRVMLHTMAPPRVRYGQLLSQQSFRRDLIMPNTFVRFYLHQYLPLAPRAIWLDADTIVKADVAELYRMRLRNHSVAAGLPEAGLTLRRLDTTKAQTKGVYPFRDEEYNTGVLLFDLDEWRLDNYTAEAEYWTHYFKALGGDQVGLNMALLDKVDKIQDWRWNARGFHFGVPPWRCLAGAKILHWSGAHHRVLKPWQIGTDDASRYRYRYDFIEPYVLDPPCSLQAAI